MKRDLKILFLYPNLAMKNLLPPAIGILAACLRNKGFEVDLFDTTYYSTGADSPDEKRKEYLQVRNYDLSDYKITVKKTGVIEDFRNKVTEFKPDIIGVSVVEDTLQLGLRLIESLGRFRPMTIFGGIHISYLKEDAFKHKEIDAICIGEGEEALIELCERMRQGKEYTNIKNLYFRNGKKLFKNKVRPLVDLDSLPVPDYSLFDKNRLYSPMQGRMYKMLPIDFDRGCLYNCNFCVAPAYRQWYRQENGEYYYRKKSPGKIIEEMKYLKEKHGLEFLYFNSDTLLALKDKTLEEILTQVQDTIKLPFWCQTRVETVTRGKIRLLKESGCSRITIGLEHGNEKFRKRVVGKNFTNKQFIEATRIINKAAIPLSINNIIGFPYETRKLIFDTIELNRKVESDSVSVFIFYPYSGTNLHNLCIKNNLIDKGVRNPTLLQNSVIKNRNLSREHLNSLLKTFCLYVKFPKERWDEIKVVEESGRGSEAIFKRLSKEYREKYF